MNDILFGGRLHLQRIAGGDRAARGLPRTRYAIKAELAARTSAAFTL
jgi:hypothetical protein